MKRLHVHVAAEDLSQSIGDELAEIAGQGQRSSLLLRPISRASAEWAVFRAALTAASLPTEDLDGMGQHFFTSADGTTFGGYFIAGPDALLRSIVVPPHAQGRGLGRAVVEALLLQLKGQSAERAWLLTTTAGSFFERLDFTLMDRRAAPASIAATPQFQGVCSSSATLMYRPVTSIE